MKQAMKDTILQCARVAVLALLPGAAFAADADQSAAPKHPGISCVRASDIEQTQTVDPKTIIITLKQRGHYKRMNLANDCTGLMFQGFAYSTQTNELCNVDPLRVFDGEICMIRDIVDIDADDAKALLRKKR